MEEKAHLLKMVLTHKYIPQYFQHLHQGSFLEKRTYFTVWIFLYV